MKQVKPSSAQRTRELAEGPVMPLLVKLAMPAILAQLIHAAYSIVDRMYIGHMPEVGTTALTGLGLTFPIIMIISSFSCLPGMGGAPLAAIAMGKGDNALAQRYLGNALTMLLTMSLVLTAGFQLFLEPLLTLFGGNSGTLPYAVGYLRIYLMGTLFSQLATGLNSFINTQGFTGIGTMTTLVGAVLNVVLDPIFIYGLGMGIEGAAIATVISQFVSAAWVMWFFLSDRSILRLTLADMKPDRQVLVSTCSLGVSPFIFRVNESVVVILLNRLILIYGGAQIDLHIAVMTTLANITQVFFMPLTGLVAGAQPILSYNKGAGSASRLRETVRCARLLGLSYSVAVWALMMLFPRGLAMAFSPDPAFLDLAAFAIRLQYCTVLVMGMQMVNQNAFVALGNVGYSFLFGIMRKILVLIPLALILPRFLGMTGVYAAEPLSNLITTGVTYLFFERYMGKLERELGQG